MNIVMSKGAGVIATTAIVLLEAVVGELILGVGVRSLIAGIFTATNRDAKIKVIA